MQVSLTAEETARAEAAPLLPALAPDACWVGGPLGAGAGASRRRRCF